MGLSTRKACLELSPGGGGGVGQNICHLEAAEQGGRGCLSKGSEVQFIKITLQVPGGAEAATPPLCLLLTPEVRLDKHIH